MDAMPLPFEGEPASVREPRPAMPPINGSTPESREASRSGALAAWKTRSPNLKRMRELWTVPRTLHEMSVLSGLPLASVCSLKAAIEDELVPVGFELVERPGSRATKRTRWQLKTHVVEKDC